MNIDILLPFKEKFSKNKASAVSITVKNSMKYSSFKNNIKVYGRKVENPFYKKNFIGLENHWILHGGHNKSLAHNYYKKNKNNDFQKKILEIHNRPYLFNYLFKKIKNIPSERLMNERIRVPNSKKLYITFESAFQNQFNWI